MDKFALQLLRVELLFGDVRPDVTLGVVLVELVKCTNLNKSKIEQNTLNFAKARNTWRRNLSLYLCSGL